MAISMSGTFYLGYQNVPLSMFGIPSLAFYRRKKEIRRRTRKKTLSPVDRPVSESFKKPLNDAVRKVSKTIETLRITKQQITDELAKEVTMNKEMAVVINQLKKGVLSRDRELQRLEGNLDEIKSFAEDLAAELTKVKKEKTFADFIIIEKNKQLVEKDQIIEERNDKILQLKERIKQLVEVNNENKRVLLAREHQVVEQGDEILCLKKFVDQIMLQQNN